MSDGNDARERVSALLAEKEWTWPQLATRAGVSLKTIDRLRRGEAEPTVHTRKQIAEALGVTITTLWPVQDAELDDALADALDRFAKDIAEIYDSGLALAVRQTSREHKELLKNQGEMLERLEALQEALMGDGVSQESAFRRLREIGQADGATQSPPAQRPPRRSSPGKAAGRSARGTRANKQ